MMKIKEDLYDLPTIIKEEKCLSLQSESLRLVYRFGPRCESGRTEVSVVRSDVGFSFLGSRSPPSDPLPVKASSHNV